MKFIRRYGLILIILTASFFRLYMLSSVPPSPSLDEVSIGYNAYSILKTGADEYGNKFPLLLRAYDDFRPALYVYLVIPFVFLFDLSVLSVRLPSVVLSLLTVFSTYFLVKSIFKDKKEADLLAIGASLFLAVSPWHIYISRLGHEVNAALSFFVFALTFFFLWIARKKAFFLPLSAIFFALSFYSYQSTKIFIPLIVLVIGALYLRELLKEKTLTFFSILLGLAITIPVVFISLNPQALLRLTGTSAFDYQAPVYYEAFFKQQEARSEGDNISLVLNDRRLVSLRIFSQNFISHFNPYWLFLNRGEESFKIPNLGLFHLWELPLMLFGVIFLYKSKFEKRLKIILSIWLIFAFLPSSIATQAPHAMRSFNLLPLPQIIASAGLYWIFVSLRKKKYNFLLYLVPLLFAGSILFMARSYFVIFPREQSASFQYFLKDAAFYLKNTEDNFDKIVVSNEKALGRSYMFYLFYTKYDPKTYQDAGGTISGGFEAEHRAGKVEFRKIDWEKEERGREILYVGNPGDFPKRLKPLSVFRNLDGEVAAWAVLDYGKNIR